VLAANTSLTICDIVISSRAYFFVLSDLAELARTTYCGEEEAAAPRLRAV
jgi:hypothetical protein